MSELKREPTLIEALIPVFFLIAMLATNVYLFGSGSLDGSNQMALLLAAAVAGIIGIRIGVPWEGLIKSMVKSIGSAMPSILILLLIGALAGTWLISGIVPAMIYYGLHILNPTIFLVAACIICALVSVATGSSWSTIATVGIALLGIGQTLGLSEGVIGGAIISGAYFGDKMSPLSDTTNLAPAMAGTDLFTHIRYMTYTTVPSILITLVIFLIMGFFNKSTASVQDIEVVLSTIQAHFNINPWLFLVPVAVIVMIVKRVPALPALLVGVLLGGIFAIIFQPQIVADISKTIDNNIADSIWKSSYMGVMKAMYGETQIATDNVLVTKLLKAKGMYGMLNTVWLILCAMAFGGAMEAGGLLRRIAKPIIAMAKSTGSLIASTVGTCIFFNATASDQYMAIVVPGRMFADTYRKRGLKPENLSRTLEDSGTVTSVLIPWNTCGATQSSILTVDVVTYLPFCFFNLISPIMTMIYGYIGIKIRYYSKGEKQEVAEVEAMV